MKRELFEKIVFSICSTFDTVLRVVPCVLSDHSLPTSSSLKPEVITHTIYLEIFNHLAIIYAVVFKCLQWTVVKKPSYRYQIYIIYYVWTDNEILIYSHSCKELPLDKSKIISLTRNMIGFNSNIYHIIQKHIPYNAKRINEKLFFCDIDLDLCL